MMHLLQIYDPVHASFGCLATPNTQRNNHVMTSKAYPFQIEPPLQPNLLTIRNGQRDSVLAKYPQMNFHSERNWFTNSGKPETLANTFTPLQTNN